MKDEVFDVNALRALRAVGDDTYHPLAPVPYLLCDPRGLDDDIELSHWLRQRPCPVIGIGTAEAAACDVIVASAHETDTLLGSVRRAPLAATVLVQLLRIVAAAAQRAADRIAGLRDLAGWPRIPRVARGLSATAAAGPRPRPGGTDQA